MSSGYEIFFQKIFQMLEFSAGATTTSHLSAQYIYDHARTLVSDLSRKRQVTKTQRRPIIFVAHSLGGIVVKSALIHSSAAREHALEEHRSVALSTYGIFFMGTPHQGGSGVALGELLVKVVSIFVKADDKILRHLERDSEFLQQQLGQYALISSDFVTKFAYEVYPTSIAPGKAVMVVPIASAVVPGVADAEPIAILANHLDMVKFVSRTDGGYEKVSEYLILMVEKACSTISARWETEEKMKKVKSGENGSNTYYETPSSRVSQFVERVELLREIEMAFANITGNTFPKIVVLVGMGGQGKTQLALEYCRVARKSGKFQAIFWIDASSSNSVSRGFETIAEKISSAGRVFDDIESKMAFVKETLRQWRNPWLMVFDNYDQPSEFRNITTCFPQGETGAILFTSRHADSERLGTTIRVMRMAENEGLELLLRQSKLESNDDNAAEGRKVIQKLGYLPLAIDQAGAYISARKLPLQLFAKHYNERKEFVLKHTPSLWEYRRRLGEDKDETLLSVFTTWELSFQQIGKNEDERAMIGHFLTLSAFFDATNVGEDLFRSQLASTNKPPQWIKNFVSRGLWNQYRYQDIIVELLNLSLLQNVDIRSEGSCFSLHPLVTDWLKLRTDQKGRQKYTMEATAILTNYINAQDLDVLPLQIKLDVLSHVDMCIQNNREYLPESDELDFAFLRGSAFTFGYFYDNQGRLAEAEAMYERALAGYEKALGPDHTSTLYAVNNLGNLYSSQGRLTEAEAMYERALAGFEKALGPDHTSTLRTVGGLGDLYKSQGRLVGAEAMCERALAGYEKALGPDHTSTLNAVNNLGNLYSSQGRLTEAEAMYERALAGFEKALGPDHTSTLRTVGGLGDLYSSQGRLVEAEAMYERALAGFEKALGPDHTSTLNAVNNLGNLYSSQGGFAEAEAMYERALAGYEKALGPDHTSTLNTVNNLGLLYSIQGRLAEAEAMYERALAGREKALGPDHTSTLNAVNNLGNLYSSQGRFAEAEAIYERALAGYEKALGPDHTSTLNAVNNLGLLYSSQGRLAEAEVMCERALAGFEKALGPDNTSTLGAVDSLGNLYSNQGRLAEAEVMYERTLAGYEKALGPDHTLTLKPVNNLGLLYSSQGRLTEAEAMCERALAGFEKALGPDHMLTLGTVGGLGDLYGSQGRLAEAEAMYERALAGYEKALGPDHKSTLEVVCNLGLPHSSQGRLTEARAMYEWIHTRAREGNVVTKTANTSH
ncbi:MAG: hypothetical protein M1813_007870 [Trichoglossum hirsutum]|nr:MAG: hypothetical protein M1813_007870 [Trichoglossum hirsutum]